MCIGVCIRMHEYVCERTHADTYMHTHTHTPTHTHMHARTQTITLVLVNASSGKAYMLNVIQAKRKEIYIVYKLC